MARPATTVEEKLEKITFDIDKIEELAGLGLTDAQIGAVLDIDESTLNRWKQDESFLQALKRGKAKSDSQVVKSLYQRATGYNDENAIYFSSFQGNVSTTPYTKHYAPDVVAQIFWLKNRQPEQWREKVETDITGDAGELAKIFAAVVSAAGTGKATPRDNSLPAGGEEIQDGPRGETVIQDGDRKEEVNK